LKIDLSDFAKIEALRWKKIRPSENPGFLASSTMNKNFWETLAKKKLSQDNIIFG
jgi:hypothetical protein